MYACLNFVTLVIYSFFNVRIFCFVNSDSKQRVCEEFLTIGQRHFGLWKNMMSIFQYFLKADRVND